MKKICLVIPTLTSGGAERVMSILANHFSNKEEVEVHLVLYVKKEIFYKLNDNIKIHSPDFDYKKFNSIKQFVLIFLFLRNILSKLKPKYLVSFGGKYNSFVILASLGLKIKTYVSDRSRPDISYGFFQDNLNKWVYRLTTGYIAQTSNARDLIFKVTKHKNIKIIPNPVPQIYNDSIEKEKIILNVGRFIKTKQQEFLIDIFNSIEHEGWKLWLVGDGEYYNQCVSKVNALGIQDRVVFWGNQKDVFNFYHKSKVFAFTSISEGFPNSLAEAMSAGCACISFDCNAGPRDLIQDGNSGFLVQNNDTEMYKYQFQRLLHETNLVSIFSNEAVKKIQNFKLDLIAEEYYKFITEN